MVKSKNLFIVGILFCTFTQAADKYFFATINNESDLTSISKIQNTPEDIQISKSYSSYINTENVIRRNYQNKVVYEICNTGKTNCFTKYLECHKGLINQDNPECNSKFYSVNSFGVQPMRKEDGSISIIGTTFSGLILTPIATVAGSLLVEKSFNDLYNNSIDKYSLEINKQTILNDLDSKTTKYNSCDISKLITDDIVIAKKLICQHNDSEGLFIFNGFDGTLFSRGNAKFVTLLSSDELKDEVLSANKITQALVDEYLNMEKLYPSINLPAILPEIRLEKTEFETLKEFEIRKNDALASRENEQKRMNKEYIEKVKERNENIFDELKTRNKKLLSKIDDFRIQSFLAVSMEPHFEYISFDAETKQLFGWLHNGQLKQKVTLNINATDAKKIKENKYTLATRIEYLMKKENDFAKFEADKLILSLNGSDYKMTFTDINYKPTYSNVTIPSYDIQSFNRSITDAIQDSSKIDSNELKALQNIEQWRVKSMTSVTNSTIVHTNAKAPDWYQNINCNNNICGVGRAETQEEAFKIAMSQVGCSLKSDIKSNITITKTNKDGQLSKVAKYNLEQTCKNNFQDGEIIITNSAEMDGWYYIKAILNKN